MNILIRYVSLVILIPNVLMMFGCAAKPTTQSPIRYIGYQDQVFENERMIIDRRPMKMHEVVMKEAASSKRTDVREIFRTGVHLKNGQHVLLTREYEQGNFATNFGDVASLRFGVQQCNSIEVGNGAISCKDLNAPSPTIIQAQLRLEGRQKVSVNLPFGLVWKFGIYDGPLPLAE